MNTVPRGRINATTCLVYKSSSLVFTLFSLFESDNQRVASRLLLIHRFPHFTLFPFIVQVPLVTDNVAQVHQALEAPAAPVQAPQGYQPAQQEIPDLGEQVHAPPIEGLATDMVGILFPGIWLFFCDFCKYVILI